MAVTNQESLLAPAPPAPSLPPVVVEPIVEPVVEFKTVLEATKYWLAACKHVKFAFYVVVVIFFPPFSFSNA